MASDCDLLVSSPWPLSRTFFNFVAGSTWLKRHFLWHTVRSGSAGSKRRAIFKHLAIIAWRKVLNDTSFLENQHRTREIQRAAD